MRLGDYIKALQAIAEQNDYNLEVQTYSADGRRIEAPVPVCAHALILKGRESKSHFFTQFDAVDRKGGMVVRV